MYQPSRSLTIPPMVNAWGPFGNMPTSQLASHAASAAWTANSRAHYNPIYLPAPCVIRRVWWANGDTVSATYNVDCGVYADAGYKPGTRLVSSGSTAQGTALQVQFVDVTDTALAPGLYWLAMACDTVNATFFRQAFSGAVDAAIQFIEASAFALPATATPAESNTGVVFVFGFATTASP